jgi:hypothetical protein
MLFFFCIRYIRIRYIRYMNFWAYWLSRMGRGCCFSALLLMAEIQREEAGGGAESGTEADEGRARGQLNRCAVKGGEVEREHRRAREQEKEGGRADEGEGERETWRGGRRESELSREAEGNGAATGLRYRHMGGREGEGRVSRRGGDKVMSG